MITHELAWNTAAPGGPGQATVAVRRSAARARGPHLVCTPGKPGFTSAPYRLAGLPVKPSAAGLERGASE